MILAAVLGVLTCVPLRLCERGWSGCRCWCGHHGRVASGCFENVRMGGTGKTTPQPGEGGVVALDRCKELGVEVAWS